LCSSQHHFVSACDGTRVRVRCDGSCAAQCSCEARCSCMVRRFARDAMLVSDAMICMVRWYVWSGGAGLFSQCNGFACRLSGAAPFCDAYDLTLRWFVCVSTSHVRCDGLCIMRRVRCYGFVFERVLGFDPQTCLPLLRLCVLIVLRIFFGCDRFFFFRSTFP
jgi:hypothetical protein